MKEFNPESKIERALESDDIKLLLNEFRKMLKKYHPDKFMNKTINERIEKEIIFKKLSFERDSFVTQFNEFKETHGQTHFNLNLNHSNNSNNNNIYNFQYFQKYYYNSNHGNHGNYDQFYNNHHNYHNYHNYNNQFNNHRYARSHSQDNTYPQFQQQYQYQQKYECVFFVCVCVFFSVFGYNCANSQFNFIF